MNFICIWESLIGQCLNIPVPKIGALQMAPKHKMALIILTEFSNFWRSSTWIELHRWYLQEINSTCIRGTITMSIFSKLALLVRCISLLFDITLHYIQQQRTVCQATANFFFQGNTVNANHIWESMCSVFALISYHVRLKLGNETSSREMASLFMFSY
jgi:hypothetical protein